MREKIFDLTISLVAMFLAIMLIGLFAWISYWVIGVEKMGSIEKFMDAFSGAFFFLVKLFVLWIALIFLGMFVLWLFKDEGMMILPFEVATGEGGYSGKSISDLLTAELRRIKRIHEVEAKKIQPMGLESETSALSSVVPKSKATTNDLIASGSKTLTLPPVIPRSENLAYKVTEAGAVQMGPAWFLIGPLLASLKQLWPGSDTERVIRGSLQKYGSVICLVAHLEHHEIRAWEVRHEIRPQDKIRDEQIPFMVRDLAFKIARGLSSEQEDGQAKTWQGLKYVTEAWDAYYRYTLTEDEMELERAQESCLLAAKAEVGYEEPFDLLYNVGIAYLNKKRYDKAEKLFRQAVDLKPDAKVFQGRSVALGKLDQWEEALEFSDKAIKLNPQYAEAWYNRGIILDWLGRHKDAIKSYDKAIELNSQYVKAWYNRGNSLSRLGKHKDAIKSYDKAIELNSQYVKASYNRGNAFYKLGVYKDAIESYDIVIGLDPQDADAWYSKGNSFGQLGRDEDAIKCYDKAIKLNPQYVEVWYNRGNAFVRLEKYKDALESYNEAININSEYAEAWNNKGAVLDQLGRHEEAIASYQKTVELDPNFTVAWIALARLYRKLGREEERAEQCKLARDLIEKENEYDRACFEAVCGSADEALDLLRSALEKKQSTPEMARQDPDFEFIRADPRFQALLDEFSGGEESGSG